VGGAAEVAAAAAATSTQQQHRHSSNIATAAATATAKQNQVSYCYFSPTFPSFRPRYIPFFARFCGPLGG